MKDNANIKLDPRIHKPKSDMYDAMIENVKIDNYPDSLYWDLKEIFLTEFEIPYLEFLGESIRGELFNEKV